MQITHQMQTTKTHITQAILQMQTTKTHQMRTTKTHQMRITKMQTMRQTETQAIQVTTTKNVNKRESNFFGSFLCARRVFVLDSVFSST